MKQSGRCAKRLRRFESYSLVIRDFSFREKKKEKNRRDVRSPSNSSLGDVSNVLAAHSAIQSPNPLESIRYALRMRDSEMSAQPSDAQRRSYIDYSIHACSRWLRAIFDGATTVPPALTAAAALRQRKEKKEKKNSARRFCVVRLCRSCRCCATVSWDENFFRRGSDSQCESCCGTQGETVCSTDRDIESTRLHTRVFECFVRDVTGG